MVPTQGAQLQGAYEVPSSENNAQGWGASTWALADDQLIVLLMVEATDDSGNVIRVASTLP